MAKEVIFRLLDDLTGNPIAEGEGETIRFTYNESNYEIDLSRENAEQFHKLLSKYVKAGRKATGREQRPAATQQSADKQHMAEIRNWAEANGHKVSPRGRIAQSVLDAYDAAH